MPVKWSGKVFKYVLFLMDVFSQRPPPVQNEQPELSSTSGINLLKSQSHSNKDRQHVSTTRWKWRGSQFNGCNTDYGPCLNPDILENIIKTTVLRYPQMRLMLWAVSKFFICVVGTLPLPQISIPQLSKVANICHLSVQQMINMKGKNSGPVIGLRNTINSKNSRNAWVSLVAYGYGWYGISKIYWRTRN